MEISFNPCHWPHVPVWFWPAVWWNLFWLRKYMAAQEAQILFQIQVDGRIVITHVSDAENDLRAWLWDQQQTYRDHWIPMDDPSGEAHLNSIRYWTPRYMARGERISFVSKRVGFYPAPTIDDSS